tara:strand:+ start:517 stop:735 length:219 start_codon:yes stop_codon:yes gene_type:complete
MTVAISSTDSMVGGGQAGGLPAHTVTQPADKIIAGSKRAINLFVKSISLFLPGAERIPISAVLSGLLGKSND